MIDGNKFVELAGKLAAMGGSDEAAFRTAVSRAYYGVFHLALSFLDELGVKVPANANAHAAVQQYLIGCGHEDAQQAGMILSHLHADRIKADYRLGDSRFEDVQFVRLKVASAHDARSALDACRSEDAKITVKDGITNFKQKIKGS